VYLISFLEGTCAHSLDPIHGGTHAHAPFPQASTQTSFISPALHDPLIIVLAAPARPQDVWPASEVPMLDISVNRIGNRRWMDDHPTGLLRTVGLLPITLFGQFVVASLVPSH
jgi:hypothetical protein